ncbi:MAG: response regulator transcription factor [Ruminococcaceae bacterium]|nr:response regulator transcription factor [Oscillospiraceae bacterium]
MYNILICDDEKDIVSALKIYLNTGDYNLFTAFNGLEAVNLVKEKEIHLILMDIMMPIMDGIEAMREIRSFSNIPIILLTAKSEEIDKISGLDAGADDYITKPFKPFEVLARVKSQIRRYMHLGSGKSAQDSIIVGNIEICDKTKMVFVDGEQVALTPTEYEILKLFMENPGQVFSPSEIYKNVWKDVPLGAENTVAVHIRHLREKIEINPAEPRYLKVVWGQGYKIESGDMR